MLCTVLPPAPRQKKGQVAEEVKGEEEASECLDCPLCLEVMDCTDQCPGCRAHYDSSQSLPETDAAEARDTEDVTSESNGFGMALSNLGLDANAQSFTPSKPARHAGKVHVGLSAVV